MISNSLLTLIHFTLLFIIGLLFTIFLSKIKNAIFIEKFGIFGRGELIDDLFKDTNLDVNLDELRRIPPDFDFNNNNSDDNNSDNNNSVWKLVEGGVVVNKPTGQVWVAKSCKKKPSYNNCQPKCVEYNMIKKKVCWNYGGRQGCRDVRVSDGTCKRYDNTKFTKKCDIEARWVNDEGQPQCDGGWDKWYDICDENNVADPNETCTNLDGKCVQKVKTKTIPDPIKLRNVNNSRNELSIKPPLTECNRITDCEGCPINCKGITLPCSTACETGSNRFIVTQEQAGSGSPCPVISDCKSGSGLCGSTVEGPNVLNVKTKKDLDEEVQNFEYPWIGSLMTWDEKIGSKIGSDLETKLKTSRDIKINLNNDSNLCEDGSGVYELGGSWRYKCDSTGSTGSLIKISNFKNKINGIFSYSTVN